MIAFGICVALMGAGERFGPSTVFAGAPELQSVSHRSGAKAQEKPSRVGSVADKLPLYFVENKGQIDPRVDYYVQGKNKIIYFTPGGLTLVLNDPSTRAPALAGGHPTRFRPTGLPVGLHKPRQTAQVTSLGGSVSLAENSEPEPSTLSPGRLAVKLEFVGADSRVRPQGEEPTRALISYFVGPEAEWKTGLRTYRRLVYRDLWPGIDLVYSGTVQRLKYMFVVNPGADPSRIKLRYRGADSVVLTDDGRLEIQTSLGGFQDDKPYAYQEVDGQAVDVSVGYELQPKADPASYPYGFHLGSYDAALPLIIDPTLLVYAGFIGGAGDDRGNAIAVDGEGSVYITGETNSTQTTFPDGNGFGLIPGSDKTQNGGVDAFVAKLTADGTALLYATYLGGSGDDRGKGIALQPGEAGCPPDCSVYIVGETNSTQATFSEKIGPDQTQNGGVDAFVAKLNSAGTSLVYAGFIGGSGDDKGNGIAVDSAGKAYVTGETNSTQATFPDGNGFGLSLPGPDKTQNGGVDAFVAKVKSDGSGLDYAGYVGGSLDDRGNGIALQPGEAGCPPDCSVYIVGETSSDRTTFLDSNGFGAVPGFDHTQNGGVDAFVVKVTADASGLDYATYIGGSLDDRGLGIAVDSAGNAYITGETNSGQTSFPDGNGFGAFPGFDHTQNGGVDAFVAKVTADASGLDYATYVGGLLDDRGLGIAVDSVGNAYITGETNSGQASFPDGNGFATVPGPDQTHNGGVDAFVVKLTPAGTTLVYSGFVGGSGDDRGKGIALQPAESVCPPDCTVYIVGETNSTQATFPDGNGFGLSLPGPDQTHNGGVDAFVAKICTACANLTVKKISDPPKVVLVGDPVTYTITVTNKGPDAATNVVVTDTLPDSVVLVSATPSTGPPCVVTTTIDCNLGTLSSGASSATVIIVVTTTAQRTLVNTVSVAADQADPDISNNTATARTVATLPNLVVSKFQAVKAAIPGTGIVIDDTTMNSGKVTAGGPGPGVAVTRFYLSTDAKADSGDTVLGSRNISLPLAAGATDSGSTAVVIPPGTALGKYFLIAVPDAVPDPDGVVEETQENNKKSRRFRVTRPDLTVTALKAPGTAAAGSSIFIEDTTKNTEKVAAVSSGPPVAVTRFYLSTDSAVDGGDAILGSRDIALPLAAKTKSAGSTTVTIPLVTAPGVYFVLAVADGDGAVTETNEGNNARSRKITITP